jgi:2-keto-4-pentenoate hydratase/2-oxohepta-3-ene-1,7-dioic acid hydratase in catechol pathway
MRLVSFIGPDGRPGYGALRGADQVVDLTALPGAGSLRAMLAAGKLAEAASFAAVAAATIPLSALTLAPVIPDPDKIICVGLNYHDHVMETGRTVTEKPEQFDYEGELAVVIGRGGRHIAAADALAHVAGYACYNEGSVRDWQRHTSQFLAGKTFEGTGAFGPWLVTADEIPDPSVLTLETRLNGKVVQHTSTNLMITSVPDLIAYISTVLPLLPGDVIVSGTPGGVGSRRVPPLWLEPGDTVEVEISGIGTLSNNVVAESARAAA